MVINKQYILLIAALISLDVSAGASTFRLNSGAPESLSNDTGDGFYNLISAEIFRRLKINMSYHRLSSEQSLIQANNGTYDGNIARVQGMEKKWPNLVRVPESVITWEFSAFSFDKNINLNSWASLKPYSVGYVRGWQIYTDKTKDVKKVLLADNPAHLFSQLKNYRIDVALFERNQASYWFKKIGYSARRLSPPLAKKPLFIYVHKKHKSLIPKMAKTIAQMKKDGAYQGILFRTLAEIK